MKDGELLILSRSDNRDGPRPKKPHPKTDAFADALGTAIFCLLVAPPFLYMAYLMASVLLFNAGGVTYP